VSVFPNSKGKGSYGAMEIFEKIEKLLDAKGLRFADLGRATGKIGHAGSPVSVSPGPWCS